MITAVAESAPLTHVPIVGETALLQQYVQLIMIVPQVYAEFVTEGAGSGVSYHEMLAQKETGSRDPVILLVEMSSDARSTRSATPPPAQSAGGYW